MEKIKKDPDMLIIMCIFFFQFHLIKANACTLCLYHGSLLVCVSAGRTQCITLRVLGPGPTSLWLCLVRGNQVSEYPNTAEDFILM